METFPRTLEGLRDALGLSLAGAPRTVMAGDTVIRRFEGGRVR